MTRHKIRLTGIDAPESKPAFGQASKRALSEREYGREVSLECGKTDRYPRSPHKSQRCASASALLPQEI